MTPLTASTVITAGQAYGAADALDRTSASIGTASTGVGFGAALGRALQGAVATGRAADAASVAAIGGHGSITDVVTAVSRAELALQTTASIRDRMVQAYQDIMRMPI